MVEFMLLAIGGASALLTQLLAGKQGFNPVRASAIVTLLGGLVSLCVGDTFTSMSIASVMCGASFVGMSHPTRIQHYWTLLSGTVFSGIFCLSAHYFQGIGGTLGAMAFVSVALTLAIKKGNSLFPRR